jgi:hypothetical protein
MIVSVINPSGVLIYSGHQANKKIERLVNLGNTKIDSAPPASYEKSKWDGSNWSEVLPTALEDWIKEIVKSDNTMMPRYMEDLITSNASLVIPAEMKKRYDDKIKVRGERP